MKTIRLLQTSLLAERVDSINRSGNQVMARDAEWGLTLMSLPGREGLDLSLGLSYSPAATWTHSGPYIYFDEDNSSIAPGFRFVFLTIQDKFFNAGGIATTSDGGMTWKVREIEGAAFIGLVSHDGNTVWAINR